MGTSVRQVGDAVLASTRASPCFDGTVTMNGLRYAQCALKLTYYRDNFPCDVEVKVSHLCVMHGGQVFPSSSCGLLYDEKHRLEAF